MFAAKVVIVTPAPPGSRAGNRRTALRWARILRSLGCRVRIAKRLDGGNSCELLIALHAGKSHESLRRFRERYPERPALLALTGTDLYRDIRVDASAAASLRLATGLIVLQKAALAELTPRQRDKTHVIHQSVTTALVPSPPARAFRICVLGHLREEKDPFCTARALRALPDRQVEVVQAGKSLARDMEQAAIRHMQEDARYRWVGELSHWAALRLLARSHAMVISSKMEGGAHVVSEAIAIGVPVIASDIPGNRGLLGEGYPGFYPCGDEASLAELLRRAIDDRKFLLSLAAAVRCRRPLVDPRRERKSWQRLLRKLRFRPC